MSIDWDRPHGLGVRMKVRHLKRQYDQIGGLVHVSLPLRRENNNMKSYGLCTKGMIVALHGPMTDDMITCLQCAWYAEDA